MFARPDLSGVVVARGLGAERKTFPGFFADGPGTFAETPIVVFFVGASVHHAFGACRAALDGVGADGVAHKVAGEDADGDGTTAVG